MWDWPEPNKLKNQIWNNGGVSYLGKEKELESYKRIKVKMIIVLSRWHNCKKISLFVAQVPYVLSN